MRRKDIFVIVLFICNINVISHRLINFEEFVVFQIYLSMNLCI